MDQLKRLRVEKGLSQARLAARAGLDPSTVNQIERGAREASPVTLRKLADALDISIAGLLESESPKAQAPLPLENGPAGPQRREDAYQPWLEFINRYADRWDEKITRGVIEPGAVDDFIDVLDAVGPALTDLGLKEKQEQPPGYPYSFGPIMGQAITRLLEDVLEGVVEACAKLEKTDELARLRHSKEELTDKRDQAASG